MCFFIPKKNIRHELGAEQPFRGWQWLPGSHIFVSFLAEPGPIGDHRIIPKMRGRYSRREPSIKTNKSSREVVKMTSNTAQKLIDAPKVLETMGVNLIEMRCPACKQTQQFKLRGNREHLTSCTSCHTFLMARPVIDQKPNAVKISLDFTIIPTKKLAVVL